MPDACTAAALTKVREAVRELQEADFEGVEGLQQVKAKIAAALQAAKEAGASTEDLLEAAKTKTFDVDDPDDTGAAARRARKLRKLKQEEAAQQKLLKAKEYENGRADRVAQAAAIRRARAQEEEKQAEVRRAARAERAEKARIELEQREKQEVEEKAHRKMIKEKAKALLMGGGNPEDGTLALMSSPADNGEQPQPMPSSEQDVIPPIDDGPVDAEAELERALKRARQADVADAAVAQAAGGADAPGPKLSIPGLQAAAAAASAAVRPRTGYSPTRFGPSPGREGGPPVPAPSPDSEGDQKVATVNKEGSLSVLLGRPVQEQPAAAGAPLTAATATLAQLTGAGGGLSGAAVRRLGCDDLSTGGVEVCQMYSMGMCTRWNCKFKHIDKQK